MAKTNTLDTKRRFVNRFEIAEMKLAHGKDEKGFWEEFKATENVHSNKLLLSRISSLIRRLRTTIKRVAVNGVAFFIAVPSLMKLAVSKKARERADAMEKKEREEYERRGEKYPETAEDLKWQNSNEYRRECEAILVGQCKVYPIFYTPEIQSDYRAIRQAVYNKYPAEEAERIRRGIDLSENGKFIINGRECAIIRGFDEIKRFTEHIEAYKKTHPEYNNDENRNVLDEVSDPVTNEKCLFVDLTDPLVNAFIHKDLETGMDVGADNSPDKTADRKSADIVLAAVGLAASQTKPYQKATRFEKSNIVDVLRQAKEHDPSILNCLSTCISVSTKEKNNHILKTDENFYYVLVPATEHKQVIAIPKTLDVREPETKADDGLLFTINMSDRFAVVDPKTFEPTGKEVQGSTLILNKHFMPIDLRREKEWGDFTEIDGHKYEVVRQNGLIFGVSVSGKPHAVVLQGATDRWNVEIPNEIKVGEMTVPVNAIMNYAFRGNTDCKNFVMGDNIRFIGSDAFKGVKHLEGIKIGDQTYDKEIEGKIVDCKPVMQETVPEPVQDIHNDTSESPAMYKDAEKEVVSVNLGLTGDKVISDPHRDEKIAIYKSLRNGNEPLVDGIDTGVIAEVTRMVNIQSLGIPYKDVYVPEKLTVADDDSVEQRAMTELLSKRTDIENNISALKSACDNPELAESKDKLTEALGVQNKQLERVNKHIDAVEKSIEYRYGPMENASPDTDDYDRRPEMSTQALNDLFGDGIGH